MTTTERIYTCTMQILYMICRIGWDLCLNNLAKFSAFKTIYTPQFVANAQAAVKAAEAIKDNSQRNADTTQVRQDLEESLQAACGAWQQLKCYITTAYKKGRDKPALKSAGQTSYAKAAGFDWAEAQKLLKAGTAFLTDNQQKLIADGGMPATFAATYNANAQQTLILIDTYLDVNLDKGVITADKIAANNAIYASLMAMFADAQQVFKKDRKVRSAFTYTHAVNLAGGYGMGSLRGGVKDSATGKAIPNVFITVFNENQKAETGVRGRFTIRRIAAGNYTLQLNKFGFDPVEIEITVQTGTIADYDLQMTAVVEVMKVA